MTWQMSVPYLAAAAAGLAAAQSSKRAGDAHDHRFWLALALLLGVMAACRATDLQRPLMEGARRLLRESGRYADRRSYQREGLLVLTLTAALALTALLRRLRRSHRAVRMAAFFMVLVVVIVAARASSYHYLDRIFERLVVGIFVGSMFETAAVLAVGGAALLFVKSDRKAEMKQGWGSG